jgi:putative methyltransferase (TIGR04325 family)
MSFFRTLLKEFTPPIILRAIRLIRNPPIQFEGSYTSWDEASANCSGYDAGNILEKVLKATLKVKSGEAVFERDSVLFDSIHYAWPVLTGLMWVAARDNGKLNVLDYGGSLGSSFFQNSKFLKDFPNVRWNVVEQEHYVLSGRQHIQNECLRFYPSIDSCLLENKPNVVLLSGVLPYLPDPFSVLNELVKIQSSALILDRTPYVNHGVKPSIKIQKVPKEIYSASYPCQFLSERELISLLLKANYSLIEEFSSVDDLDANATWKGHVFRYENTR